METVDSIFLSALEKSSEVEVKAYLSSACGQDSDLRQLVERLIAAHQKVSRSFLEEAAPGLPARVDDERGRAVEQQAMHAGLAATFGPDEAVVIGGAGHSVLRSLSKQLTEVPNITLHDAHEERDGVLKPGSPELRGKPDERRYHLMGEIARGGMGAIIKGRDTDLGREIAIKVLLDSHKDRPELIQRFVEEAQIGGQLQHPGIVPVYELGQFGDQRPFFSMKLIKGKTLAELLVQRKEPSEDWPKLLGIFEQVCQTMSYAHSKGVIHRDLKPANIMVGAFGEVQVMDWGLSKVLSRGGVADEQQSLDKHRNVSVIQTRRSVGSDVAGEVGSDTRAGSAMGTPAYMPPEQALGEIDRLDARADVFGLGAILAEILTGQPPYVGQTGTDTFRMASRGKIDNCHKRLDNSSADPQLIVLAKTALSPEPEDRMRHAGELADGMTSYLEGVQAKLKATEIAKERQSKKYYAVTAALMFLIASAAVFGTVWFQRIAAEKSVLAQQKTTLAEQIKGQADSYAALAQKNEDLFTSEQSARQAVESSAQIIERIAQTFVVPDNQPIQRTRFAIEAAELARNNLSARPRAHESLLKASLAVGGLALSHPESSTHIALSPDQHWLACSCYDKTIRLWKCNGNATPKLHHVIAHGSSVVTFSNDSRWLVTGRDSTASAMLYDLTADNISASPLELIGHVEGRGAYYTALTRAYFSPDSQWLVTSTWDGAPRLWNLTGDKPVTTSVVLPTFEFRACAFSPDSRRMALAGSLKLSGTCFLLDLSLEDPVSAPVTIGNGLEVGTAVAFTPNGQSLITNDRNGVVRKWDLTVRDLENSEPRVLGGEHRHGNGTSSLAVSGDGRWAAIGSTDHSVHLWDLTAEPETPPTVLVGHENAAGHLVFSPDSRWLFTGSNDHSIRRWDLTAAYPATTSIKLTGHDSGITTLCISGDGESLFSSATDKWVRLWDIKVENPGTSPLVLQGHTGAITVAAISPDGLWAATASTDHTARLWDLKSEIPSHSSVALRGHTGAVTKLLFVSDGQRLVTAGEDGTARVWSCDSPSATSIVLRGHEQQITSLAIRSQDSLLATSGRDGRVCLWDLEANDPTIPLHSLKDVHVPVVQSVDFNFAGNLLVTGGSQEVRILDLDKKHPLENCEVLNFESYIYSASFLASNRLVVDLNSSLELCTPSRMEVKEPPIVLDNTGSTRQPMALDPSRHWLFGSKGTPYYSVLRRWDLDASDPAVPEVMWKHTHEILSVAMSLDGRFVVTGSRDQTAKVGEFALGSKAIPMILQGHTGDVTTVAMSPDARWVLTGSTDNTARLWDLDFERLIQRAKALVDGEPDH